MHLSQQLTCSSLRFCRSLFAALLAVISLVSLSAQSRYQGLLWEISGKGTTQPGYLYGTMHIPEKLAYNLSDSFFVALKACDVVALETNHDVWQDFMQQMKEDAEKMNIPSLVAQGYDNYHTTPDLYQDAFQFKAPEKELLQSMFEYKPAMANEFLYRSSGYSEDNEENTYLDLFIFQAGKKLGKTVIGLETMEGSFEAVTRARIPDDDLSSEERSYRYTSPEALRDAYRKQDLNALDSLNKITNNGKNFRKWMLDERNIIMANGIDSVLQSGKSIFSAVGAAHLPGNMGVIELLRQKGYSVRPVTFSFDTDKKTMKEIENIRYPVKMSRQWSPDSVWSAEAPGKFYTTSDNWRIQQHLCADMSNGAYYAAYSIQTWGQWTGQSPEYIATRIDSLIYEHVPGKIQERRRFTTPFPGHDIVTRTRRGDIQHYKIYVTPAEILMFIMGGNGDYVNGPEGTQFFNTIEFSSAKNAVKTQPAYIRPPGGMFSVTFPTEPLINNSSDPKADKLWIAACQPEADSAFYLLSRVAYHDWNYIEEDTFELNIIAEKIAEPFTRKTPDLHLNSTAPFPSLDFHFQSEKDQSHYYGRLIIDGHLYYLLGCRKRSEGAPNAFFDSFSIEEGASTKGWTLHTDSTMQFTVKIPKLNDGPISPFGRNMEAITKEIIRKTKLLYEKTSGASLPVSDGATSIKSPETGEEIYISSQDELLTYYPDADSLRRSLLNRFSLNHELSITELKSEKRGDTLLVYDFLTTDTNSTRGILSRFFQGNTQTYTLSATINTQKPHSRFVTEVFNSFVPRDSSLHARIAFGARDISFLERVHSPDSMVQRRALEEMRRFSYGKYEKGDYSAVEKAIAAPEFHQLKMADKSTLLTHLAYTDADRSLAFLDRFYNRHSDSVRYQNAALLAMAAIHTPEAVRRVIGLWENGAWMEYQNQWDGSWHLSDSIELLRPLAQKLVRLAQLPLWHPTSTRLLLQLKQAQLIRPSVIKPLLPMFLSSLRNDIEQGRYNEETKRDKKGASAYYGYDDYSGYNNNTASNCLAGPEIVLPLVASFYHKEDDIRHLMDKALQAGAPTLRINTLNVLLAEGHTVAPEIIREMASDDRIRFATCKALHQYRQLDQFPNLFADTLAMARSLVMQALPEDFVLDSIKLLGQYKTVFHKQPAQLYFFDVKKKKNSDWTLYYVTLPNNYGLTDADYKKENFRKTNWFYSDYSFRNDQPEWNAQSASSLTTEKEKQEFIRKKTGETRFYGRRRYRAPHDMYGNY